MEINIKVEPKELAELLSAYASNVHKTYQDAEERIGNLILSGFAKLDKKEKDMTKEEVPSGGYFH